MKRILIAAAVLGAASVHAQGTPSDLPKPKCEKPQMPGEMMRSEPSVTKRFNQDVDRWEKCMKAYIDERQAAMKANEEAANAAIKDYNDTIKALNEAGKGR
ncbi:MAG TPA: hypothetical protein VFE23_12350 [Usitatibacter sp.]|jgi:hypothetical protein|nr:hypothetical protein [Usitatibacter sp.]